MQQETKKRIYIDTSIPSSYYTLRTDEDALAKHRRTRQWWNEYANQFSLMSSIAVIGELTRGRSEATQMRQTYCSAGAKKHALDRSRGSSRQRRDMSIEIGMPKPLHSSGVLCKGASVVQKCASDAQIQNS